MGAATPIFANIGWLVLSLVLHAVLIGVPVLVLMGATLYLLSLPMRRQENARLFLNLLETILRDGRPLESSLISLAESRDITLGVRFHLATAYLQEGHSLATALERSRLLPRPMVAMLAAGQTLGDMRKVLPACRLQFRDATSGLNGALNYLFVLVAGLAPVLAFLSLFVSVVVAPKLNEIFYGMGYGTDGYWLGIMLIGLRAALWTQSVILAGLLLASVIYLSGPDLPRFARALCHPLADWLAWGIPWKRKRMQRNFAAMLATLLDNDVPEPEAMRLAADCTGNAVFGRRARRAIARLSAGETLATAVHALDRAGEFRWRLANAHAGQSGFTGNLRGWLESLDARAFQQEQAAAHLITTSLVLINGACVGCICAGMFGALRSLIEQGTLW